MEDLKTKLAIHKTEPNQRDKDTKALVAQTGQQGKRHQEEPCWVLRQRWLLGENRNRQALIVLDTILYIVTIVDYKLNQPFLPLL